MADYLSRHPSQYEGSVTKAEELFNTWFTVSVVNEIVPTIHKAVVAKSIGGTNQSAAKAQWRGIDNSRAVARFKAKQAS